LLAGGAESPIQKLQDEFGADLNVIRSRYVVVCKGQKDKVKAAVKRLDQFLHGGDGHTVARVTVTEQALGLVIGKNGSKRAELEKNHEGVNLFIHRSNRITIRGPDEAVEGCRIDILRLVASVRIQQVLKITPEEYIVMSKPDTLKRIAHGIPVQVTVTEEAVKIRGIFADVRDTMGNLREVLTGVYVANVELESSQLSCVRGACRDPSHLERMRKESNAEIKLDLASNSIVLSGKRSNVKKAKHLVVLFLDFLLPDDFARLEVSRPVQVTVGDAASLADIAAISGATAHLDRDLSSILIQSSDPEKVKKASELLKTKIDQAEKLAFVVSFTASEQWMIPLIIGKGGNRVNTLRLDTGCSIDINKADRSVTVTGEDEVKVGKARELLNKMIDDARRQCVFMEIPQDAMAAFVGRGGTHIRAFATEHKIEVERLRKSPTKVKITGEEDAVQAAKVALQAWIDLWEMKQAGRTIAIDKPSIPAVLGKNGSVIASLQKEYGCKVEINREEMTLTVRGSTEELRENAIDKINDIVNEDRERHNSHRRERPPSGAASASGENQESATVRSVAAVASTNGIAAQKSDQAPPAKSNDSLSTFDSRKDRTTEFARRPVGLTIVEKEASKPKKKRNRNKNRPRDISDDSTLQVGSSAGRSLFNLLVSESSDNPDETNHESNPTVSNGTTVSLMVNPNDEQWDSSTVSSAAIDSSDPDEHGAGGGAKPYIKSASGFTVRV
jgi:rRNA processing protein Krr1/Pno1